MSDLTIAVQPQKQVNVAVENARILVNRANQQRINVSVSQPAVLITAPSERQVLISKQNGIIQAQLAQRNDVGVSCRPRSDIHIPLIGIQGPPGPQGPPGQAGEAGGVLYRLVTADYYPQFSTDYWIDVKCDSGDVTIWLPQATSGNVGLKFIVQKDDGAAYVVHVKTILGQTIDNNLSDFQIYEGYSSFGFMSRGTSYTSF